MPESRNRNKHHHAQQPSAHHAAKTKRSAALVVSILTAVLGLAVAYFTRGTDATTLITGTLIGGAIGFILGKGMDKSFAKN